MKKLLTVLLTLFMVFTLVGCNSKQDSPVVVEEPEPQQEVVEPVKEEEPEVVGGFVEVEDRTLTDELKGIFNKAYEGYTGMSLEPVELYQTQVVAGTNYKFVCSGTKTTNPPITGTYFVTVYQDLDGNCSIIDVETVTESSGDVDGDPSQYSYWVVVYDQLGNELSRTTAKYGTIVKDPDGNDVKVITNTYFHTYVNYDSSKDDEPAPTPAPTPTPACENTSTYLIRITSPEGADIYKYDVYTFDNATNSYIRTQSERTSQFNPGYSISLGNYYHSDDTGSFNDLGKLTLCEHVNTHTLSIPVIKSIGGKIFHIVDGDNGATYHFYSDEAGTQEITGWTDAASLANAKSYIVIGTPTYDKFYVMGTFVKGPLIVTGKWVQNGTTNITTNGVGDGKTNTDALIGLYGETSGSIWSEIKNLRSTAGGYNDWFIGTTAEQDLLRTSGVAGTSYTNKEYWSSVEADSDHAYMWNIYGSVWESTAKRSPSSAIVLRAF